MQTVLVVDDEEGIRDVLRRALEFHGLKVLEAEDGERARDILSGGSVDMVLLDVMMPRTDGFALADSLRTAGDRTPIIFLTAKGEVKDRLQGLQLGGDDYIVKPFSVEEVVLRVQAVLRRTAPAQGSILHFANLVLDEKTHEVRRSGEAVLLSPTEYLLLRHFMLNPGEVFSKAELLEKVWGYDFGGERNVVELYVSYLRKKLETGDDRVLHTLRGVGYVLRSE